MFPDMSTTGWAVYLVGWVICFASVFFAVGNKSYGPPYVLPFWACFATLVGVAAVYVAARLISERWRSKAVRSCFSPYIVGAAIWPILFVAFFILDRIVN